MSISLHTIGKLSAHSNSVLTIPNNIFRHTCYCLSSIKQFEYYNKCKQYEQWKQRKESKQYYEESDGNNFQLMSLFAECKYI